MEDKLVSVLLFVEDVDDDLIKVAVDNVKEQTHSNIDLIISSFKEENSEEIKNYTSERFLNARWINSPASPQFINETLSKADGEYVFYKTINNVAWFPRHIEAHLEEYKKDPKSSWGLSHIENRDLAKAEIPFNTLSFRIDNPPKIKDICMDEICHTNNIDTDWIKCLVEDDGKPAFYAGLILQQWTKASLRGIIPAEITVEQWVEKNNQSSEKPVIEDIEKRIGAPAKTQIEEETNINDEGEIVVEKVFPTIVGNINFEDYNFHIRSAIKAIDKNDIKSVGVKRTVGMGDVILVEPIIRKIKNEFPNAEINFYTSSDNIVNYFESKPDNVHKIEEKDLMQDFLSTTNNEVKYDLDLSYESRLKTPFINSYIETLDLSIDEEDISPTLISNSERLIEDKYVVVCGDGSGWPGKTWPISYYEELISHLQEKGYTVIETGNHNTDLTPSKYHACEFDDMVNLISNCEFYIGGDNGPMHIARGFNKPCIVINGAALTYISNPNRENIMYLVNNNDSNLGLKHQQFINYSPNGQGITFVPIQKDGNDHCGIRDISPSDFIEAFNLFEDNNFSGSFISNYESDKISFKEFSIEEIEKV